MTRIRPLLPFWQVNRRGCPGYFAGFQKHHIIPLQVRGIFRRLFAVLTPMEYALDDFSQNGLLLPATEANALKTHLPLHCGPHRLYSEMVQDRLAEIERSVCLPKHGGVSPIGAEQIRMLQRSLAHGLIHRNTAHARPDDPHRLNRRDPMTATVDFASLDAAADMLWAETAPRV